MYANNYTVERFEGGQRAIYLMDPYNPGQNAKIVHFSSTDWTGFEDDVLGMCTRGSRLYARLQNSTGIRDYEFELDTSSNYV